MLFSDYLTVYQMSLKWMLFFSSLSRAIQVLRVLVARQDPLA